MRIDKFIRSRESAFIPVPFRITFMDGTHIAGGREVDPEEFEQRYAKQIELAKQEGRIIGVDFNPPEL